MALLLMGKRYYDFTNDQKQNFKGVKLHCNQQVATKDNGILTEVVSVGEQHPVYPVADDLPFGTVFTPVYNKFGKVEDIIVKELPEDKKK